MATASVPALQFLLSNRNGKMSDFSVFVPREALVKSLVSLTGRKDVDLLDNVEVKRASSAVEGFTSLVLRVKVSYRLPGDDSINDKVFIVKCMPQAGYQRELMKTSRAYSKESLMFSEVAPFMKRVSGGKVEVPLPVCYYIIRDEDNGTFFMDDLVAMGYRSANRSYLGVGLDYAHCSIVMKRLGIFHALTIAGERTLEPGKGGWTGLFPEFCKDTIFYVPGPNEQPSPIQSMVENILQNLKEICKEVEGLPKEAEASGVLEKVIQGVWPTVCKLKEVPSGDHKVLTHGDCWMNNMMFKYKRGENGQDEPVDVKFFDLQVAKVCHPGIDLLYFMYLCTRRPFREKYFDSLINEYYESLTESLKIIDGSSPSYTISALKLDVAGKYKPFGVCIALFFSPLILLGDDFLLPNAEEMTAEKMEEFFKTGNATDIKIHFGKNPIYRARVEELVKEFLEMALPNGLDSLESSPLLITS